MRCDPRRRVVQPLPCGVPRADYAKDGGAVPVHRRAVAQPREPPPAQPLSRSDARREVRGYPPAVLWAALGPIAVAVSVARRWSRDEADRDPLERWTLAAIVSMTGVGIAGVLLGAAGWFAPAPLTLASAGLAAALWPWRRAMPSPVATPGRWRRAWLPLALGLLAVGLRLPAADYALAGRDQGTYTLRAHQMMRTGRWTHTDRVLAEASAQARDRSGPDDVLGLFPKRSESWREDRYESAYRPGWYLADRERGHVVPQFFHLHPTWMATAGLIAGPDAVTTVVVLESFLLVLVLFFVARRLFASPGWGALATLIVVSDPLAIWVHRTALSETPTSLLLWAAILAIVRAREHDPRGLDTAALLLGATAWVRGNAWLTAPLLLGVLWLLPPHAPGRRRGVMSYLTLLIGSVLVHAGSTFPYLADELNKQLHVTWLRSPWTLVGGVVCLALVWWAVDALAFDRRDDGPRRVKLRAALPWIIGGTSLMAVVGYVGLRATSADNTHARLDPALALLGPVVVLGACVGMVVVARRTRVERPRQVWLAAIATTLAATLVLYAQRNLPRAGLFYYGRYLAPELLPAAALLCVAALRTVYARLASTAPARRWWARGWVVVGVAALGWTVAGPLLYAPQTRLREFEGAGRLVDAVADRLEPDAIVIAGGEGWHHGHTYNQVGGALAMTHGVDVLPYHGREALYATAYELLIGQPQATNRAPRPVYLLVGEATHHYRPTPDAPPRAALDGLLPPPFVARSAVGLELFTDRLTPVERATPTRITRDQLRMVLLRIDVDPYRTGERVWSLAGEHPSAFEGAESSGEQGVCMARNRELQLKLPSELISGADWSAGSLVIVMTPGTASANPKLELKLDGHRTEIARHRAAARPRDTLGPFVLPAGVRTISLRGLGRGRLKAPCTFGGVAEIRWLQLDRPAPWPRLDAQTFAPHKDLGHPVEPTEWVAGRGLSRYRPGITPPPELVGLSMVVTSERGLKFAPEPLPLSGASALDLVITLTRAQLSPEARLVVRADDTVVVLLDPPDDRAGVWQSKPHTWTPQGPVTRWSVALIDAAPDDFVHLRDIGLFSRAPVVRSHTSPQ